MERSVIKVSINVITVLASCLLLASCQTRSSKSSIGEVPEVRPGILQGYLAMDALPNSLALVPEAPAADSRTKRLDLAVNQWALSLKDTARWKLAAADAELIFPDAARAFSCASGIDINAEQTPYLYLVLRRSLADAGLSTYMAKNKYARQRPFLENGQSTCTPEEEEHLTKDGSYPSGHTAIGWAWALILAEVAPERANEILRRGMVFGESRMVCNVHWQSDVAAGRTMGAATVAKLHSDPVFVADLDVAKKEYRAALANGSQPGGDCQAEAKSIADFAVPVR